MFMIYFLENGSLFKNIKKKGRFANANRPFLEIEFYYLTCSVTS